MTLAQLFSLKTLLLLFLLAFYSFGWSTTDYVDNDPNELQNAIQSGTADSIRFNFSGTMDFSSLGGVLEINRSVVLYSVAPVHVLFNGASSTNHILVNGAGIQVVFHGITFTNFTNSAIELAQGSMLVENCVFEGNNSSKGGAILSEQNGNSLNVQRCAFFGNQATGSVGGAIYAVDEFKVINSTFFQNECTTDGGAIYYSSVGIPGELAFNTFYDNQAPGEGGGLCAFTGPEQMKLYNNLFLENVASANSDCYSDDVGASGGYNYWMTGESNLVSYTGDVNCCVGSVSSEMRSSAIIDGFGQKYFTNTSNLLTDAGTLFPGINSIHTDQRGGYRRMDASGAGAEADIGAIENTYFTVKSNDGGNSVSGSFGVLVDDLNAGLRQAPYYFAFDISGALLIEQQAPYSINVDNVFIDGYTQSGSKVPGYKDIPGTMYLTPGIMGVELSGSAGSSDGIRLFGSDTSKVRGLALTNFSEKAISIQSSNFVKITGNHVGLNLDGSSSGPNQKGVVIESSFSAKLGGLSVAERNVISGNSIGVGHGIEIVAGGSHIILNNLIGSDPHGVSDVPNSVGIFLGESGGTTTSENNIGTVIFDRTSTVGAPYYISSNLISGNSGTGAQTGIYLGQSTHSNSIAGNFIGTDISGASFPSPNHIGIFIDGGSMDNSVGATTSSFTRNVISGNDFGIQFGASAGANSVRNNWIGVNGDGTAPVPNNIGISINDNSTGYGMIVGGGGTNEGNVISGNTTAGIVVDGADGVASNNRLSFLGNTIGLAVDGTTNIANGKGIHVINGGNLLKIGSSICADCGNLISGNSDYGIHLDGSNDVIVYNNRLGVDNSGNPAPNQDGIHVDNSTFVTIGGMSTNEANEIAFNTTNGVSIVGASSDGVDLSANSIYRNGGIGVDINQDGATGNDLGDPDSGPNGIQNYPVLVQAFYCGDSAKTMIEYDVSFESGFNYAIQFFIADADDEEGKTFLGEQVVNVTTIPQRFVYAHPSALSAGTVIVANASKINGSLYSTSEFSQPFAVETPVLTITSTDPSICGTADGIIVIESNPSLTISLDYDVFYTDDGTSVGPTAIAADSNGSIIISALDSGTYNNFKMEIAGCMIASGNTINLSFPAVPNPSLIGSFTVCEGSTESYSATGNGGTFSWTISGGSLSSTTGTPVDATWPSVSAANIEVTEQIGSCSEVASHAVTINANPTVSVTPADVTCNGLADGTATATASGSGTIDYLWSTGSTLSSLTGLSGGTYDLTVTDDNGCTANQSVVINEPSPVLAITTATDETCAGFIDGTLTSSGSGGVGSYTFSWDGGPSPFTSSQTGVSPGTYTVTVTDANDCDGVQVVTVNTGTLITGIIDPLTDQCFAGNSFAFNGGNSTISVGSITSYSWDFGDGNFASGSSHTHSYAAPGIYTVTLTVSDGICSVSAVQDATVYEDPTVTITSSDPTCNGSADGIATAAGSGGTGTYTYFWLPMGSTLASATGLSGGTYDVTVEDGNGCTANESVVLNEPSALLATAIATDETCAGFNDGTLVSSGSGGTGSYTFSWDGGPSPSTSSQDSVSSGTYVVTVTDGNGCSATQSATVASGALLTAVITPVGNQCLSGNSFTFDGGSSTISSGTITSYNWLFGDGNSASGMITTHSYAAPGTYTVALVVDDGTCTSTTTIYPVDVYPQPSVAITSKTDPSCNGFSNGSASSSGAGGTGTLNYSWSPYGGSGSSIAGLPGGTSFTVTVSDDNGCTAEDSVTLTDPPLLEVDIISGTDPTCNGLSDGTAAALGTGGIVPLSYTWTPTGGTGATATGLSAGIEYLVTVSDSNSCTASDSITLTDPPLLDVSIVSSTNPTCSGFSDGDATSVATGGTGSLTYGWTPSGGTGATATGLSGGIDYTITVTDSNSCTASDSIMILEPAPLVINIISSSDPTCNGFSDGTAVALASGGTGTLNYTWIPPGSAGAAVSGLSAGITYVANVSDGNACNASDSIVLNDPPPLNLVINDPPAICSPLTVDLTDAAITAGSDPGTLTYWLDFAATSPLADPSMVASSGTYFIQLDDGSCQTTDTVFTEIYSAPTVEAGLDQTVCDGELITLTGSGALSFSWDNGAVDGIPFAQAVGTVLYTVTGTDANGCEGADSVLVTVNELPFVEGLVTDATCGLPNGSVEAINASGGSSPYSYSFAGGVFGSATLFDGLGSGTYSLAIQDFLGCEYSTNVVVNSTGTLPLTPFLNGPFDFCEGDTLGPIDATGTVEAGTFNWYLNDTTAPPIATTTSSEVTFASLPSGTNVLYVIHSIAASGCVSNSGSAVVNYYKKDYSISSTFTVCPDGSVQLDGILGTGSINWYNASGELDNALVSDPIVSPTNDSTIYTFIYQNGSCSFSDSVVVILDTSGCGTFVNITNAFSPNDDGVNDGWEISGIDLHPNNQVSIFNRWGDLINEFVGYNNTDVVWRGDGTAGQILPTGTYFYVLELFDSGFTKAGWVQLTRD